jgi:hypothetical protein
MLPHAYQVTDSDAEPTAAAFAQSFMKVLQEGLPGFIGCM